MIKTHNLRLRLGAHAFSLMRRSAVALSKLQSAADGRHGPTHEPKSAFQSQWHQNVNAYSESNISASDRKVLSQKWPTAPTSKW
jgi:hypothetical protein